MSRKHLPEALRREIEDLAAVARAQQRPTAPVAAEVAARAGISLLWAWRLAKGWHRAELLSRLRQLGDTQVDESMVWRWETGERDPTKHHLDRLCQVYQTRPDRLGYGRDYTPAAGTRDQPRNPRKDVNPMRRGYLTGAQAAERLHVSPRTVGRWAREGRLEHLRTLGGHRRYDPAYIDRLASQMARPAGQPDQH